MKNTQTVAIDAKLLRVWKAVAAQVRRAMNPDACCQLHADHLDALVDAYIERAALMVVNDQMETQGADIAPYWAHYAMASRLRKAECDNQTVYERDGKIYIEGRCRDHGSLCITEYCAACYAYVWWQSQHKHKAQAKRMTKKDGTVPSNAGVALGMPGAEQ